MILLSNDLFTLTELKDKTFVYHIQNHNGSQEEFDVLLESLQLICNAPLRIHTVVFDTLQLEAFAPKKFLIDSFKTLKNTGLLKFVLVTSSITISCLANLIKTCCGSESLVHTCQTVEQAMKLIL